MPNTASHIKALKRKHNMLERKLGKMVSCPSSNPAEVAGLKRQKLHLKDEIERTLHSP